MIKVTIPDTILDILRMPPEEAEKECLMLVAVKAFEMGRISVHQASVLAGVLEPEFLKRLAELAHR